MARALIGGVSNGFLTNVAPGLAALPVAGAVAVALWTGRTATRGIVAALLLAAVMSAGLLPPGPGPSAIHAAALIALPGLACLRRHSPALIGEATMAGAGPIGQARLAGRLAAPGLAAGLALWCTTPYLGHPATLLAAALPLALMPVRFGADPP